ncbi:hypothetical protein CKM354_000192000 [Cercospora kikuchii]|uniref:Uncharacterized protein n=1 Tax=Cercospora kikuchii TaxID=84275 RepID=A0A9P3CH34_9PEZI|nr:uncharacterized protein CKM354_000192000 [Cercospora kikuchii]GIZ38503.1 hypothetical protein CKM354_000192000 [Cercospora kikuchii]
MNISPSRRCGQIRPPQDSLLSAIPGTTKIRRLDCSDTIKFSIGRLADGRERTYHLPKIVILDRSKLVTDAFVSHERAGLEYVGDFPNIGNVAFNAYVHLLLSREVFVNIKSSSHLAGPVRMALVDLYILAAELTDRWSMNKIMDALVANIQLSKPRANAINKVYKLEPEVGDPLRRLFVAAYTIGVSRTDDFQDLMRENLANHQLCEFSFDLTMALLKDRDQRYPLSATNYYVEVESTPPGA